MTPSIAFHFCNQALIIPSVDWVALSWRGLEWIELPSRAVAYRGLSCCLVPWRRVSWVAVSCRGLEWIGLPARAVAESELGCRGVA